jgi:hypothetical protein
LGLESIPQLACIQFLMLNLKMLFSEIEKKKKVENFTHFEKDVFFEENDILRVFRIFRSDGSVC